MSVTDEFCDVCKGQKDCWMNNQLNRWQYWEHADKTCIANLRERVVRLEQKVFQEEEI